MPNGRRLKDPNVKQLFRNSDMKLQATKLWQTLHVAVDGLSNLGPLVPRGLPALSRLATLRHTTEPTGASKVIQVCVRVSISKGRKGVGGAFLFCSC